MYNILYKYFVFIVVDFGLAQTLNKESTKPITSERDGGDSGRGADGSSYDCDITNEQQQPTVVTDGHDGVTVDAAGTISAVDRPIVSSNKCKRKASEIEETENRSSTGKRLRVTRDDGTPSTAIENRQQQPIRSSPYIPSPFKSPLKQLNEISTPKKGHGFGQDSPLTRHIKSAVLGYSIHAKYQQHQRTASGNATNATNAMDQIVPSPLSAGTESKHGAGNDGIIGSSQRATTVASSTPQSVGTPIAAAVKYTVDNRRRGSSGGTTTTAKCMCYGRPTVCNTCVIKKEIHAPRAGTPGYRPSEVLLKYPNQTTAVDVWAAGVILISILSGCYPFFKGTDDYNALAEIITVFGDAVVKKTAAMLGRNVCISRKKQPLHLRKLCIRLRNRCKIQIQNTPFTDSTNVEKMCDNCQQLTVDCLCQNTGQNADFSGDIYPDSVYDLLAKLLAISPSNRISAGDALDHPFFTEEL